MFYWFSPLVLADGNISTNNLILWDAILKAIKTNPDIVASQQNLITRKQQYRQTQATYLPSIRAGFSANYNYSTNLKKEPYSGSISATQKLLNLSQIQTIRKSKKSYESSNFSLESTKQNIILTTTNTYIDLISQFKVVELSQKNYQLTKKHVDATEQRYAAGELTKTDVNQAKSRLANAKATLVSAIKVADVVRKRYKQIVGSIPPKILKIPSVNSGDIENQFSKNRRTLSSHPTLLIAKSSLESAKIDQVEARSDFYPTIDLSASGNVTLESETLQFEDYRDSFLVGVSVTIPIFSGGGRFYKLKEKLSERKFEEAEYESTKRQIKFALDSALLELNIARELEEVFIEGVQASKTALEGVQEEFEAGARIALDVLDAQNELFSADISLVKARFDIIKAQFQLLSSSGTLTLSQLRVAMSDPKKR